MMRRCGKVKKKVLIIDDDINTCKEIKYSLQNETTDVYNALSASDGFEQFTKHQTRWRWLHWINLKI